MGKLSREAIVEAAVRRIDAEGLDGLSMRRVGKDLGVEAMSLYRYVPNKTALLDAIHASVLEEVQIPAPTHDWKSDARRLATSLLDTLLKHPGAMELFPTRPAYTEGSLDRLEASLAILERAGMPEPLRLAAMQSLYLFVVGHALFETHASKVGDDLDYRSLPAGRYPNLRKASVPAARQSFRHGLDVWVRGVEASAPQEEPQSLTSRLRSLRRR
ncbi:MAG: TetR/AcrR family transcriptional regulator C-terminal domain-containing protein [Proteobacteria bacterium]|nr:TetR/AcrR family transcriptional regulator C-terminal domain-containing protein [Pseudomonadota bacterium]